MSKASGKAARLTCWKGRVEPRPLTGGITNQNFVVEDAGQRYFVRIGDDIPIHGIMRFNELAASRAAQTGIERLDAFIDAWGGYIPEIYGIAKALLAMKDTDEAAAKAWHERMQDMREGCAAAIGALNDDNRLLPAHSPDQATDILWTMLSVRNWEQLTIECGWPQKKYTETLKSLARQLFVAEETSN